MLVKGGPDDRTAANIQTSILRSTSLFLRQMISIFRNVNEFDLATKKENYTKMKKKCQEMSY